MNNIFIRAKVLINNYRAGEGKYIVARLVSKLALEELEEALDSIESNELWYYGRYDSMERAEMVAAEFENAVVIEEE